MCKKSLKMVNDRGNGSWFNHITILLHISKSFGKMRITNPFILMVKAGRKLATRPDILIAKGKKSVVNATVLVAISSPDLP